MQTILDLLAATPLLLLFVVIGLGYLLGTVKVAGFSLGPAAVLFTGIFLGSVDSRLRLPDFIYVFGLILFVYTIGLQSGSTFFGSFNRRGLLTNAFAFGMVLFGAVLTFLAWKLFGLDGKLVGTHALRQGMASTVIAIDDLAAGSYVAVICDALSMPLATHRFIKTL